MPSIYDHVASGGDPADYALGATPDTDPAPYTGNGSDALSGKIAAALINGPIQGAVDAVRYPAQVMSGQIDPQSDQGIARTVGMAGLMVGPGMGAAEEGAVGAMGGKLATKGAKASSEDPFASIMAALDAHTPTETTASGTLDPTAASWPLYHGTGDAWDVFDPAKAGARTSGAQQGAMFMSPRADEAATYATGDKGRVLPLTVTPGNTGVYDVGQMLATRDPRFMAASKAEHTGSTAAYDAALKRYDVDVAYHQDLKSRMPADLAAEMPDYPAVSNLLSPQSAAIAMARQDGRDTAILRGLGESSGGDQVVALRPGFVRDATTGSLVYSGGIPTNALTQAAQSVATPDQFNRLLAIGGAT